MLTRNTTTYARFKAGLEALLAKSWAYRLFINVSVAHLLQVSVTLTTSWKRLP
jgi:hypothetical protein